MRYTEGEKRKNKQRKRSKYSNSSEQKSIVQSQQYQPWE